MTIEQIEKIKARDILKDAGYSDEDIADILSWHQDDNVLFLKLYHCRESLLEKIHIHTKELDCLDYLIYKLKSISEQK